MDDFDDAALLNPVPSTPEWSMRMVVDVALGASADSILSTYGLQMHEYERLCRDPVFMGRVAATKKELEKNGAGFRLKAQLQAEAMLATSWDIAHDDEVDPKVRAQIIRDTVRWAGWDAPPTQQQNGIGAGFSISINLNGAATQPTIIDGEVVQ